MAKKTATKEKTMGMVAEEAKNAGAVTVAQVPEEVERVKGLRPRLSYPRLWCEYYQVSPQAWVTLIDTVWPSAKTVEGVCRAIAYCKERNLDMMKKPVHVVPVYSKALEDTIELVWPAITEVRITATRTGAYGGKDEAVFGPMVKSTFKHLDTRKNPPEVVKQVEMEHPEWCRVDVYRMVQGVRCCFKGPKVVWTEAYATESRWSDVPNEMWMDRDTGQVEKCAEAASLRAAFPEELGATYVAEEMHGKIINYVPPALPAPPKEDGAKPPLEGEVKPAAGGGVNEFKRDPAPAQVKPKEEKQKPATNGDPRPAPPAVGEEVRQEEAHPATPSQEQVIPDDDMPAPARQEVLKVCMDRAHAATKIVELATIYDFAESELPPDSKELKEFLAFYEKRQVEIMRKK